MKTRNVFFMMIALVLVVSLLSVWFVPSVKDFMAGNTMWNGIRDFSRATKSETIDTPGNLSAAPQDSAVILIPYMDYTESDLLKIKEFLEQGGTLVLMDDIGYGNTILEYLDVPARFANQYLLDPLFCYRNQWLPKITDFGFQESNIKEVVLNHATVLLNVEEDTILALSSATSFLDVNGNEVLGNDEPQGPLPVAAEMPFGQGRLVLVSDPSLMINSMINQGDNFQFILDLIGPGAKNVVLDISHLTQSPLDIAKSRVTDVRDILSAPYPLLAIVSVVFISASLLILRTGGKGER